jgi:hypothetical protein
VARLPLELDQETFLALTDRALRERRPIVWQAEVMLREALGLAFPYPPAPAPETGGIQQGATR